MSNAFVPWITAPVRLSCRFTSAGMIGRAYTITIDTGADTLILNKTDCEVLGMKLIGKGIYDSGPATVEYSTYDGGEIEFLERMVPVLVHGVQNLERSLLGIRAMQVEIDHYTHSIIYPPIYNMPTNPPRDIRVNIIVHNYLDRDLQIESQNPLAVVRLKAFSDILVDTGATTLTLNDADCVALGLTHMRSGQLTFGPTPIRFKAYRHADVEYNGKVVTTAVYGIPQLKQPMLGMLTLDDMKVDTSLQNSTISYRSQTSSSETKEN
ncbi:unnamed protein product [Didymodactylos carnosus]|uniref:Uncharacterized protein n=1 Tax=Didymodactylos carnosus TaxID=1234261 RepID=A0A815AFQ0_9BILA|nr:unnamed protein product [Didymodactylos carnosus]CAF4029039.1 unnamed protein product [Didymodactylos carnosus]